MNRNGRFDTNGVVGDFDNNNNFITNVTETGDPEWVGVLQHPDQPYGPNNPFVARYAFIAVPIGNALDLNAIHNQVLDESQLGFGNKVVQVNPPLSGPGNDVFLRNQGVGSWEINLAAFLADLNTNQWDPPTTENPANNPYKYQEWNNRNNQGVAFEDARALLAYRYGNNYLALSPASRLFSNFGALRFDNIDGYSDGPLQTTPAPINEAGIVANRDTPTLPWAGADNTNQFFSVDDLFDSSKELNQEGISGAQITAGNDLATRLQATGANFSTYDRSSSRPRSGPELAPSPPPLAQLRNANRLGTFQDLAPKKSPARSALEYAPTQQDGLPHRKFASGFCPSLAPVARCCDRFRGFATPTPSLIGPYRGN